MALQFSNGHMHATHLLDAIQSNDTPLQESTDLVRNDTGLGSKMNDFEATDFFLITHYPVSKKSSSGVNHSVSEIYDYRRAP